MLLMSYSLFIYFFLLIKCVHLKALKKKSLVIQLNNHLLTTLSYTCTHHLHAPLPYFNYSHPGSCIGNTNYLLNLKKKKN